MSGYSEKEKVIADLIQHAKESHLHNDVIDALESLDFLEKEHFLELVLDTAEREDFFDEFGV